MLSYESGEMRYFVEMYVYDDTRTTEIYTRNIVGGVRCV